MSRLVLLSGGIDSTTALVLSKGIEHTEAIIFKYPSLHNEREIRAAINICAHYDISYHIMDVDSIFASFRSDLLKADSKGIPQGEYNKENMDKLVVPFRNGIFLSIASGLAQSLNIESIVIANHAGDHPIYKDCTRAFIDSMSKAIFDGSGVGLISPFCDYDKVEIVRLGISLNIDYSKTYSCYKGEERHCNTCPTCIESLEAFRANDISVDR